MCRVHLHDCTTASRCRILLHPRTLAAREIGRVSVRTRCCQCREKNITVASSLLSALERAADRHQRPATRQAVPTSDEEARKRSNTPRPDLWCRSDRGAHGVVEHSSTSNAQSLFAPADSTRPKTVGLWPAMRRSPAAEHLAAPPVARLLLRTARDTLEMCRTVPASDRVGIATVAPHPEPREATCGCVETQKDA